MIKTFLSLLAILSSTFSIHLAAYVPITTITYDDEFLTNKLLIAEEPTVYDYSDQLSPSDEPYFDSQLQYKYIDLGNTWTYCRGDNVSIAVIDTCLQVNHLDFLNLDGTSILSNRSALIEYKDGVTTIYPVFQYGYETICEIEETSLHATSTIGTIKTSINGRLGTALAPNVEIIAIALKNGIIGEMGEALKYALTLDVDVINISMLVYEEDWIDSNGELHEGANGIKNYLGTYIDELTKNGTVVVASSGNDATDQLAYPAALDNVIAVGAVASTPLQRFASYSNYGYNTVVAPGTVYVPSTDYSKTDELERYSAYSIVSGTSFSAPLVAASIGLYRSLYPNASAEEIRNALINSATKVTTANYDEKYGYGILSVQNFLGVEPNANYSLVIFVVIFAIVLLLLFVVAAIIILLKRRSSKLNN